ncbi:MAG TPA: hypothetical protein VNV66_09300 [Pilimelia sp.]|nr:hypothetical protein [Pilimelia sp.]
MTGRISVPGQDTTAGRATAWPPIAAGEPDAGPVTSPPTLRTGPDEEPDDWDFYAAREGQ